MKGGAVFGGKKSFPLVFDVLGEGGGVCHQDWYQGRETAPCSRLCMRVSKRDTHTHMESRICSEDGEAKCEFFSLFASQAERWVGRVVVMAFATVLPVAHRVGWYVRHDSFKLRQPAPSVGNGAFSPCLTVFCCLGLLAVSLTALRCTRDGTDWS